MRLGTKEEDGKEAGYLKFFDGVFDEKHHKVRGRIRGSRKAR
jgi:hypothetical protein